jgi:ABC-2 type transport system permease protein
MTGVAARQWREFVRFELFYQFRRGSTWLFFALFLLMLFGQVNGDVLSARENGVLFNAPIFVARASAALTLFALLVIAAVAGDVATRDVQLGMEPLLHAAPISRAAYLGGRFAGAFTVVALLLAAVPLALMLASFIHPSLEAALVGPFRPAVYLQSYLLVILPNVLVATALLFALAVLVRHTLGSYVGAALVFAGSLVSQMFVGRSLGRWELAKLLDSTGTTALQVMGRTWPPADLRARTIASDGALLSNRLLWVAIALAVLAFTFARFRFGGSRTLSARQRKRTAAVAAAVHGASVDGASDVARSEPVAVVRAPREFGALGRLRQTLTIARDSLREIATGWIWIVLPLLVLQTAMNLKLQGILGTPVLRTTGAVLETLDDPLNTVVLFVLLLAGELVWRERDANMQALADAAPVPDWVSFAGKLLGIGVVVVVLHALLMLAGIVFQVQGGRYDVDLAAYVTILFGVELAGTLAFALFAFSLHVLVNQKHVGLVLGVILSVVLPQVLPDFGITHPLLVDSLDPIWRYSDIRGFEPFLGQVVWLELYWAAWALLLAIVARCFQVRGVPPRLRERVRIARRRFTGWTAGAAAATLALVLLVGGFVFYNTNILNAYAAPGEGPRRQAEYERRYGRFEQTAQPELAATKLDVEIHPERREADVRGVHRLVNRTRRPIGTIHVAVAPAASSDVETGAIGFDRPARATILDDPLGHRVYVLDKPLQPGESLRLTWQVRYAPRGFPASGISSDVVGNGSFFVMQNWMPLIGYQPGRALTNAGERRLHGLPERPFVASLDDVEARRATAGREDVDLDVTVGTAADQTAVAPGALSGSWTAPAGAGEARGRRYFHYATSRPIGNEYAIFSARYAVRRARWRKVAIEVFHHPGHRNVPRAIRSMEVSLAQFSERFGPYPHEVLRLVEYPAEGSGLHAAPGTIWLKEPFSLLDPAHHPDRIDLPFAAVAHEVAHQWWGAQLRNARAEGIILLSESLAWYSAMGVVEQEYGDAHLQRLLAAMRRSYLDPRARADVPLLRATDWFQGYRKGAFAMYGLREYVGQENVDLALRRLLQAHVRPEQPLATSRDLLHELRQVTPGPLQDLLGDLFERNTFWELKTTRATMQPAANGAWKVSVDVLARKVVVDTEGKETNVPMNDLIEIGLFAPAEAGQDRGRPLSLAMHRVRTGPQTLAFTVPRKPASAGIDPRHLLIDVEPDDNVVAIPEPSPSKK